MTTIPDPKRIAELRSGCGAAALNECHVVATPEEMLALLDAAERVATLARLAPLCDEHGSGTGRRSGCPYCGLIRLNHALSRISYLCGPANDMQVSAFDVDMHEETVVEQVAALTAENTRLAARVAELEAAAELVMGDWANVKTRDRLRATLTEDRTP